MYWGIQLDQDLLETIVAIYPEWFKDCNLNLMAEQPSQGSPPPPFSSPSPPSVDHASLQQAMDRNKECECLHPQLT